MSTSKILSVTLFACVLMAPRPVNAQASTDLVDLVNALYIDTLVGILNNAALQPLDLETSGDPFAFGPVLSSALVIETAGFPIGSSSGGFTYFFDSTMGAAVRSSPSFGPAFAERPLTSGRGQLNVGITYLYRRFTELEGVGLDDGNVQSYFPLVFADGDIADVIETTVRMDVNSTTATFFATYGVLDKLDLSVAVPIQRVEVDARVTSQLIRPGIASRLNIQPVEAARTRSAAGIGDVAVRAKYNIVNTDRAAIAGGLDLRLPTGDERDLLGTGNTRAKLYAAIATKFPRLFPHVNLGYTFPSGDADEAVADDDDDDLFFFGSEFSYAAGAEYVLNPRLTLVGDVVGRSLAGEGRVRYDARDLALSSVLVTAGGVTTELPAETRSVTQVAFEEGVRLNTVLTSLGVKYSPGSTFIVSAHVLFPLTKAGLRSRPTPVIGIDYTF